MKWTVPGKIYDGSCLLVVEADTKEEAIKKFWVGEWDTVIDSEDWECEIEAQSMAELDEHIEALK